jgi:hypothetical protein
MITVLNLIVPLLLSLTSSAPAPAPTPTASAANNCYCQTIPLKDWGK